MGDIKRSAEDTLAMAPRCGRCEWWAGQRLRDAANATVGFTIHGLCTNADAPPECSGHKVHYLGGANCPGFQWWKDASSAKPDA